MRATLGKLTLKPSRFKTLNIPAGWRPSFWRSSIRVLVYIETLGMVSCDSLKAELTGTCKFSLWYRINNAKVARSLGSFWPRRKFYRELHFLFNENRFAYRPFELTSFKALRNIIILLISAFSGHRQGKFVRKDFEILQSLTMVSRFSSRTFSFYSCLIHLSTGNLNEESAFSQEISKVNSRREHFRLKNRA